MASRDHAEFSSRAGAKLAHALAAFRIDPAGWTCADLGASTGGFTDCLLQAGAAKVFAVERGYGVIAFDLRKNPRVVVMERTDALHMLLPEPVRLVTIDVGWTRQALILPVARRLVEPDGHIVSLVKPQYEADPSLLAGGILPDERIAEVLAMIKTQLSALRLTLCAETASSIRGGEGNLEMLWYLRPANA